MANMELTPIFYHEGSRDAMTNEELAVLIKGGERDKLPELWAVSYTPLTLPTTPYV